MRILVSGTTQSLRNLLPKYSDCLGFQLQPRNGNAIRTVTGLGLPWAADNAAFTGLDVAAYLRMLGRIVKANPAPLWVTAPDKVADAKETLRLWSIWGPVLKEIGLPRAFVLQDGQEDLELPDAECYFIGGSTDFKLSSTALMLVEQGKASGAWIHMGRVNSRRRMEYAWEIGCDSVDGTGMSRWGDRHLAKFCRWLQVIERRLYR